MQTGGDEGGANPGRAAAIYPRLRSRRTASALGEINVTPLVDVVLVLLLVFMVTAPMMNRGIDVSLPVANQPQIPPEDRITVTVDADGRIAIGGKFVNLMLLEDEIHGRMMGLSQKIVYLKVDERLRYGRVIEVIDKLKHGGVEQFGLVFDLPKEKSPS